MNPQKSFNFVKVEHLNDDFHPYPHQSACWAKMTKQFVDENQNAGIIVVPTGGGKTMIAARWLLQNIISKGGRVLWLAHRITLLKQAMDAFEHFAHLAIPQEQLGVIRISSEDCNWKNVDASYQVVFSSVFSAATDNNLEAVDNMINQSPNGFFVVIDEAHHVAARSYQKILNIMKDRGQILGLTATPWRADEADAEKMWNSFGGNVIYKTSIKDLINRGILSEPILDRVETQVDMGKELSEEDFEIMRRHGEIGEKILEKIGKNSIRNRLIVRHYKDHEDKFNKTIVFACDRLHAMTLQEEFDRADISSCCVVYGNKDNTSLLDAYRNEDTPKVITNVEIMTEGYDAPRTKTVFLCRPTKSQSLLTQMIGRALRGEQAGGTKEAYLVTFVDTWSDEFNPFEANYVIQEGLQEQEEPAKPAGGKTTIIPKSLISEAYALVRSALGGEITNNYMCLPHSWYTWYEETEDDIYKRHVLVFENQVDGYTRLIENELVFLTSESNISEQRLLKLREMYFEDIPDPLPTLESLVLLARAYRDHLNITHYTFEEKRAFEPATLAQEMMNLPAQQCWEKTVEIYTTVEACRVVYTDPKQLYDDVRSEIDRLVTPIQPLEPQYLDLVPTHTLATWPKDNSGYDLTDFWTAVTTIPVHFPDGVPGVKDLRYSNKALKSCWGFFRYKDRVIVLNNLINSPDVPRFVVEFLLYHEILHADMPGSGHNSIFRDREKRYRPSPAALQDAQQRGIQSGTFPGAWRALANQFLDTFDLHFSTGTKNTKSFY